MTTNQNDPDRMMQMIIGYWVTQVVHAAATFSIADHLAKTPATANDIADAEGTDPSATFRFLRTCASLGFGQIRWQFPIRRHIPAGYFAQRQSP
jgi:hypothetical protein